MFSTGWKLARPSGWLWKSAFSHVWLSSAWYTTRALRPYQAECIKQCMETLKEGKKRRLAVSIATGGGKTFVFTKLIPRLVKLPLPDRSCYGQKRTFLLFLPHMPPSWKDRSLQEHSMFNTNCTKYTKIKNHNYAIHYHLVGRYLNNPLFSNLKSFVLFVCVPQIRLCYVPYISFIHVPRIFHSCFCVM